MITPILVVATICATGAAVIYALKNKRLQEEFDGLESTYDKVINNYTDLLVESHNVRAELSKLKRKPRKDKGQKRSTYKTRKDKGQPRNVYAGKPTTRKRKI